VNTIRTDQGIVIGYREYGDPNGFPVLFHHGVPGSSLYGLNFATAASDAHVRLICIDRPGFGISDNHGRSTVSGWVKHMSPLTEELSLDTFSVFGYSGGGPYATMVSYVSDLSPICNPCNSLSRHKENPPTARNQCDRPGHES
jgi:pimeloyl-ACP methyl ester carboxylesterase